MKTLGNLIWLVFGGIFVAFEYLVASLFLMITIIGIPFGIQTMKLAFVALWPFGKEIVPGPNEGGLIATIMNIIWILTGGVWIALSHLMFGILFAITIIGIPFAKQHFKLMGLALMPFGKRVL